jgi:hypothetical protein
LYGSLSRNERRAACEPGELIRNHRTAAVLAAAVAAPIEFEGVRHHGSKLEIIFLQIISGMSPFYGRGPE